MVDAPTALGRLEEHGATKDSMDHEDRHHYTHQDDLVFRVVFYFIKCCCLVAADNDHERARTEAIGVEEPIASAFPLVEHVVKEKHEEEEFEAAGVFLAAARAATGSPSLRHMICC